MIYPFFIVSAERTEYTSDQNTLRTALAMRMADVAGVAYAPVSGAYKGVAEQSLALHGDGAQALALTLGKVFAQESILAVDAADHAALIATDGAILAVFTQRIAATADNFTCINGERFSFAA